MQSVECEVWSVECGTFCCSMSVCVYGMGGRLQLVMRGYGEDKSVAWAGSLGRGSIGWLLGSKGAHMLKVANGSGGEVRG